MPLVPNAVFEQLVGNSLPAPCPVWCRDCGTIFLTDTDLPMCGRCAHLTPIDSFQELQQLTAPRGKSW